MAPASSEALVLEADFVGLTAVAIASLRVVEATAPTSAAATSPCITGMYDAARPAGAVWFVTCAHGCSTPHVFAVRLLYFAGRPTGADPCSAHYCAPRRLTRPERRNQCYRQPFKMSPTASSKACYPNPIRWSYPSPAIGSKGRSALRPRPALPCLALPLQLARLARVERLPEVRNYLSYLLPFVNSCGSQPCIADDVARQRFLAPKLP